MYFDDTIYAPATVPGAGGISIIRISGINSSYVFKYIHRKFDEVKSHYFYKGFFIDLDGKIIDEILFVYMKGPNSYTRQDIVEIHSHSNRFIVSKILSILGFLGFRSADPGEFTKRAFLNGRIDLTQAEAVISLIEGKSELSTTSAVNQLAGTLSLKFNIIKESIINILSLIETYIDFPEEEIDLSLKNNFKLNAESTISKIDSLLETYHSGRVFKEGISLLIVGKPNVGKSSILNVLTDSDSAIVTDIPGTTRDLIQETITIRGLTVNLIDTAGIRLTDDPVEKLGVERSILKLSSVDLILFVTDSSSPLSGEDEEIFNLIKELPFMWVCNKRDILYSQDAAPFVFSDDPVYLSTHTGAGLEILKDKIFNFFDPNDLLEKKEAEILTEQRHFQLLISCREHLIQFLKSLSFSEEFSAIHLRDALHSIGEITGETTPDQILDQIFSRFCIGK